MKVKQIAEKNPKELEQMVVDQRNKLAGLLIDLRTKKVDNIKEISAVKKTIARALTIQRQRELSENGENNG